MKEIIVQDSQEAINILEKVCETNERITLVLLSGKKLKIFPNPDSADIGESLGAFLDILADKYKDEIDPDSRIYSLVDIGENCEDLGFPELKERFTGVKIIVRLRRTPKGSLGFEVDAGDLKNYVQLDSGLVIEAYVAKEAGISTNPCEFSDSMVLV